MDICYRASGRLVPSKRSRACRSSSPGAPRASASPRRARERAGRRAGGRVVWRAGGKGGERAAVRPCPGPAPAVPPPGMTVAPAGGGSTGSACKVRGAGSKSGPRTSPVPDPGRCGVRARASAHQGPGKVRLGVGFWRHARMDNVRTNRTCSDLIGDHRLTMAPRCGDRFATHVFRHRKPHTCQDPSCLNHARGVR